MTKVALYFVASPLQYLAARQIALTHEAGARQVLVWYKRGLRPVVRQQDWDASVYMAWPRWDPLPGPFGRHRRLRENIRLVSTLVGECTELHIHSAVFDTEAINYFLHALPRASGATTMRARILPDGLISIRRYPLSWPKRLAQYLRKLRRVVAPELDYWCFAGDRIGSDAAFCDRIYVLPGLPHEYPPAKTVTLAPLASATQQAEPRPGEAKRALVVGQPLVGVGLISEASMHEIAARIEARLKALGIERILYKGHPKDPNRELYRPGYEIVEPDEPLEAWMSHQRFEVVIGVRSSSLLFAKQLYGPATEVVALGWEHVKFKSERERADMTDVFRTCGVHLE
nr:polysialyltransferase family glycosyltransferase [uncultured Caldimonas sp.]